MVYIIVAMYTPAKAGLISTRLYRRAQQAEINTC
jgi:hypothetical protein